MDSALMKQGSFGEDGGIRRILSRKDNEDGFNLVEVMVVLVVMGLLMAVVLTLVTSYVGKAHKYQATEYAGDIQTQMPEEIIQQIETWLVANPGKTAEDIALTTPENDLYSGNLKADVRNAEDIDIILFWDSEESDSAEEIIVKY